MNVYFVVHIQQNLEDEFVKEALKAVSIDCSVLFQLEMYPCTFIQMLLFNF